jgi:hypothetical protein
MTIPALAKKVFAGLRVLHVVSNTGAGGKSILGRQAAISAVQLANKHITMFTENNQIEFRGWCKGKKVRNAVAPSGRKRMHTAYLNLYPSSAASLAHAYAQKS